MRDMRKGGTMVRRCAGEAALFDGAQLVLFLRNERKKSIFIPKTAFSVFDLVHMKCP